MRPSHVEVDLDAIRHNVTAFVVAVAPAGVCAVVKADAYGHGDVPVGEAALEAGAECLAVALVEEGVRLREAGIEVPIILLSEPTLEAIPEVLAWDLTPAVYGIGFARTLERAAAGPLGVHLKLDTGMHRVGAAPPEAFELARMVDASPVLDLEAVWTHFAVAEEDADFTAEQVKALDAFLAALATEGISPRRVHAANTAGALLHPASRRDLVRVGLGMYGLEPAPGAAAGLDLRPAMRVVSRVSLVRRLPAGARPSYGRRRPLAGPANVATVPIGYADGLSRRLSDLGGAVLIGGRRRPFAGTVTMDQIVVDVGLDPVTVGDEVVVLGRQGHEEITADEWAGLLGTISYEIVCRFGPRLPAPVHGMTLTDVPGVTVGHWSDLEALTGVTVIVPPEPNTAVLDVRGAAPGTREAAMLMAEGMRISTIQALVFTGGSAFGLASADGVVRELEAAGRGHPTPAGVVPIVPAAVVYDLWLGDPGVRPGPGEGAAAFRAADGGPVEMGNVGAGTGATVAGWRGPAARRKGGVGSAARRVGTGTVGALAVVNAVGDVFTLEGDPLTGGPPVPDPDLVPPPAGTATTLVAVLTDIALQRADLYRLAVRAHDAMAVCLRPGHTRYDGDAAFAVSCGIAPGSADAASEAAFGVVGRAIAAAVTSARAAGGIPAAGDNDVSGVE